MNSVESKMLDGDIAYVQVLTFGEKTTDELKQAIKKRRRKMIPMD